MEIVMIVVLSALILITGIYIFSEGADSQKLWKQIVGATITIVGTPIVLTICVYFLVDNTSNNYTPQAIDVYRGNTTLEITYRDSVPVDSVVIFKNK